MIFMHGQVPLRRSLPWSQSAESQGICLQPSLETCMIQPSSIGAIFSGELPDDWPCLYLQPSEVLADYPQICYQVSHKKTISSSWEETKWELQANAFVGFCLEVPTIPMNSSYTYLESAFDYSALQHYSTFISASALYTSPKVIAAVLPQALGYLNEKHHLWSCINDANGLLFAQLSFARL